MANSDTEFLSNSFKIPITFGGLTCSLRYPNSTSHMMLSTKNLKNVFFQIKLEYIAGTQRSKYSSRQTNHSTAVSTLLAAQRRATLSSRTAILSGWIYRWTEGIVILNLWTECSQIRSFCSTTASLWLKETRSTRSSVLTTCHHVTSPSEWCQFGQFYLSNICFGYYKIVIKRLLFSFVFWVDNSNRYGCVI